MGNSQTRRARNAYNLEVLRGNQILKQNAHIHPDYITLCTTIDNPSLRNFVFLDDDHVALQLVQSVIIKQISSGNIVKTIETTGTINDVVQLEDNNLFIVF